MTSKHKNLLLKFLKSLGLCMFIWGVVLWVEEITGMGLFELLKTLGMLIVLFFTLPGMWVLLLLFIIVLFLRFS